MTTFDAVIVGGGPAGASAAWVLARAGLRVAIVEKAAFPRRKVCGEFISATTWPVLRKLGVDAALSSQAGPAVQRVGFFAGETMESAAMPASAQEQAWGHAIGRDLLDGALFDRAVDAGAIAWQPWSVAGWKRDGSAYRVALSGRDDDRCELRARLLVAAHGSWERLPESDRLPSRAGDLIGFKAHFHDAKLAPGLMPLIVFRGGYGGMVHGDHGRVSFSCCIRRDALRECRAAHPGLAAGEAVITHVMESVRGVREALAGARREAAWLSAGPIRPGVRTLAQDGVFAVGNTAGEAHPLVAEGISMAIQSAWLLGETLAGEGALSDRALVNAAAAYDGAWRRHFAARVRASSLFAALMMSPGGEAASAAALERMPRLLTWGARWSGKSHALRFAERAA